MSDLVVGRAGGPPPLRPPRTAPAPERARRAPADAPAELRAPSGRPRRTAVDPRMAARRAAVLRDQGRRRLHRVLVVLGVAIVVALAGAATRTPLLDVDHIRVEGVDAVLRDAVTAAAAEADAGFGAAMLDVDPGALARAIEAVPTVADARVSREWPGTLVVQVRPRIAVASIGPALVGRDGVVIAVGVAPATPVVPIEGIEVPTAAGERVDADELLAVAAAMPDAVRGAVAAVVAGVDEGEVSLRLAGGGLARLGPPTGLGGKLVSVATVLEQVDLGCLQTLDVRVPSAPAITRVPGC